VVTTTDKKIKVEAEVTTVKNVSSGIGKGFGVVIGIFLAIIFIIVGFSVLLSSKADNIEEQANQITGQVVRDFGGEVEKEVQKIEKQTNQFLDEMLPADEIAKEKDEGFTFSPDSIVNSQNGISLSLDDLKYEIKGKNWGKITEMTITVLNKGNNNFQPKIIVLLYDEKDPTEDKVKTKEEIEFDIYYLDVGEHITKKAITNIAFNDLNLPKTLKVVLVEAFDYNNRALVVVEKEFIAE